MAEPDKSLSPDERLLALARHDLRSPLLNLSMVANLLGREQDTADLGDLVAEASRRLDRLTRDVVDFALIRLGHAPSIERHIVDVQALSRTVIEQLAPTLPNHPVDLQGAELQASVDPDRFVQLLQNLVGSAVKVGKQRAGLVLELTAGLTVTLRVEGPVLEPARLAALFTDGADDPQAGIGLYLVRVLAEAHGGTATATAHDTGTTFTVTLPA